LRKFKKVTELAQKLKDFKNNGTTWKLCYGVSMEL
jgi:hypothetical protein